MFKGTDSQKWCGVVCFPNTDVVMDGMDMGPKIWHDCNIEVEAIQRDGVKLEGIFG